MVISNLCPSSDMPLLNRLLLGQLQTFFHSSYRSNLVERKSQHWSCLYYISVQVLLKNPLPLVATHTHQHLPPSKSTYLHSFFHAQSVLPFESIIPLPTAIGVVSHFGIDVPVVVIDSFISLQHHKQYIVDGASTLPHLGHIQPFCANISSSITRPLFPSARRF